MEVYIDSLIFENILINGLILFATGKILRDNTKMWKILLGASIGAVYAVLMPVSYTHLDVYKRQV